MAGKLDEGLANQKQMLATQAKMMMSDPRLKEFLRSIDLFWRTFVKNRKFFLWQTRRRTDRAE